MIAVIGCGNMAGAIVRGIHNIYKDEQFLTYTPSFTRAQQLANDVGGLSVKALKELEPADTFIIACKPQQFTSLAKDLANLFDLKGKHFVSIMAAISIKTVQDRLQTTKVTRVMPNTPTLYNEGVSLMLHSESVTDKEKSNCLRHFSACSRVHLLNDENLFDKVTTVSGSGPAYVFQFAQTLSDQLKAWGLSEKQARDIVVQLFRGSTKLMEENASETLEALISQVTSKGGVTIEAVKTYQEQGLDKITSLALNNAYARSRALTKELEGS